jgi:hypothetical protein
MIAIATGIAPQDLQVCFDQMSAGLHHPSGVHLTSAVANGSDEAATGADPLTGRLVACRRSATGGQSASQVGFAGEPGGVAVAAGRDHGCEVGLWWRAWWWRRRDVRTDLGGQPAADRGA